MAAFVLRKIDSKTLQSYLSTLHKRNELIKEEYNANEHLIELQDHIA